MHNARRDVDDLKQQQKRRKKQKDVTNEIGAFSGQHFWIQANQMSKIVQNEGCKMSENFSFKVFLDFLPEFSSSHILRFGQVCSFDWPQLDFLVIEKTPSLRNLTEE